MTKLAKCQNCTGVVPVHQLIPLEEVDDLGDRLTPGETVPAGECDECGGLAHLVHERDQPYPGVLDNARNAGGDRHPDKDMICWLVGNGRSGRDYLEVGGLLDIEETYIMQRDDGQQIWLDSDDINFLAEKLPYLVAHSAIVRQAKEKE